MPVGNQVLRRIEAGIAAHALSNTSGGDLVPDREVVFKLEDRTRKCRSLHFVVDEAEGLMLAEISVAPK